MRQFFHWIQAIPRQRWIFKHKEVGPSVSEKPKGSTIEKLRAITASEIELLKQEIDLQEKEKRKTLFRKNTKWNSYTREMRRHLCWIFFRAGIEISAYLDGLSPEKVSNSAWKKAVLDFRGAGIVIDVNLIQHLSREKAGDAVWMQIVLDFHKIGEKVDGDFIRDLSLEKAQAHLQGKKAAQEYAQKEYGGDIPKLPAEELISYLSRLDLPRATREAFEREGKRELLKVLQKINELHERPDAERLNQVKTWSPKKIYYGIVLGSEEIFTSTFNLLFDGGRHLDLEQLYSLLPKMRAEFDDGYKFLDAVDPGRHYMSVFLSTCAQYGKLDDFLKTMSPQQQSEVLRQFIGDLEKSRFPLEHASAIAETFVSLASNTELIQTLEEKLKSQYEHTRNELLKEKAVPEKLKLQKAVDLYAIIASSHALRASTASEWFDKKASEVPLPNLVEIKSKELFDDKNVNIQRHFFYNDKDGKFSFQHFLEVYRNDKGWHLRKRKPYVIFSKKDPKTEKTILIYANKPDYGRVGQEAISQKLKEEKQKPSVIVHRGHSYHIEKTMHRISPAVKIVPLGSCGGYHNTSLVISKSRKAHILATKGTGSMFVNDDLYKIINEEMLSGKNLNWPTVWKKAREHFEKVGGKALEYFEEYIPPHKNLAMQISRTYYKLQEGRKK